MSDDEQSERTKRTARYIEDCNMARERGLYQVLRHLTQGFRWDGSEWCQTCLQDAWAWWKIAQLADKHDPELYQRMLDESKPEVEEFLNHSRSIRERNATKRIEATTQPTPKVTPTAQPAESKTVVVDQANPTPRKQRRESEQEPKKEKDGGEKKQKSAAQQPEEESGFLKTTGKIFSGLARWIATGKTQ